MVLEAVKSSETSTSENEKLHQELEYHVTQASRQVVKG